MRKTNRYRQQKTTRTPQADALQLAMQAKAAADAAIAALEKAAPDSNSELSEKELATARGEPWVGVLNVHVNPANIKNGFFELDWNDQFIDQLRKAGYGFEADPQEQIVDRWFRDLALNILAEEGLDYDVDPGVIDISKIKSLKS